MDAILSQLKQHNSSQEKELQFLRKKVSEMYTVSEVEKIYIHGIMTPKPKKKPWLGIYTDKLLRFDIILGKINYEDVD